MRRTTTISGGLEGGKGQEVEEVMGEKKVERREREWIWEGGESDGVWEGGGGGWRGRR